MFKQHQWFWLISNSFQILIFPMAEDIVNAMITMVWTSLQCPTLHLSVLTGTSEFVWLGVRPAPTNRPIFSSIVPQKCVGTAPSVLIWMNYSSAKRNECEPTENSQCTDFPVNATCRDLNAVELYDPEAAQESWDYQYACDCPEGYTGNGYFPVPSCPTCTGCTNVDECNNPTAEYFSTCDEGRFSNWRF